MLNIDQFSEIAALVKGYELKPGHAYLILANDKDFDLPRLQRLMYDIRQMHPNVEIAVVATADAKKIKVMEREDDANGTVPTAEQDS